MYDFLKVLLGIYIGFVIGYASISAGYFDMRNRYFNCQIEHSGDIKFQSGFVERLFDK